MSTDHQQPPRITRRAVLAAAPGLLAAGVLAAPATGPATKPDPTSLEGKLRAMAAYFAKVYAAPLASPDRLPKEIAVVSLSRIEAPETTAKLLEVFNPQKDRDPVVWYLAWEALHARHATLNPLQRRAWATGGLQAALMPGGFPGTTVTPLLRALAEHNMVAFEDQPWRLAARVVRENRLDDADEKHALNALRRLVAAWHDPGLVRTLIGLAGQPALAPRVDHVLRDLSNPPAEPPAAKVQATWSAWMAASNLTAAKADEKLPAYKGDAKVFPAPAVLTDPNDKRWYAELEIGALTVTDFDLAWAIDSTGSMNDTNQLVASETATVARVISLVSRRARVGAVYARHEIEAAHQKPCCQEAGSHAGWYQVKPHALTADVKALATAMAAERIPRPDRANEGNVHPGTPVLGAMQGAMTRLKWSADKKARRVVVLVGDAHLTPGTERAAEAFAAKAKAEGFRVHALATGRAVAEWADTLKAAGGTILPMTGKGGGGAAARLARRAKAAGVAPPAGGDPLADRSVFVRLAAQVVRESVGTAYRDRVDPLLEVLVDYADAMAAAERAVAG